MRVPHVLRTSHEQQNETQQLLQVITASLLQSQDNQRPWNAPKKNFFCVPTDELLRAKDDLLSEGGQSLNSTFADCFGDWFIGIPFVGDDVVAKCISKLH